MPHILKQILDMEIHLLLGEEEIKPVLILVQLSKLVKQPQQLPLLKEGNMGQILPILLLKFIVEIKEIPHKSLVPKVTQEIDINQKSQKFKKVINQKPNHQNQDQLKEKLLIEENQLKMSKLLILFILLGQQIFI